MFWYILTAHLLSKKGEKKKNKYDTVVFLYISSKETCVKHFICMEKKN